MRNTAEAPAPDWTSRRFAVWWLRHRPFMVPTEGVPAVRYYHDFAGVTLYRHGQFQAQMFVVRPRQESPWHSHPNIDSVEYGLAGSGEGTFRSTRNARLGPLILIAPGEGHVAAAGPAGGAFISFQKWLNGVLPSSVELDWRGAVIDTQHADAVRLLQAPHLVREERHA